VHHTAIRARGLRSLNAGEHVEFTVIQKDYCWHATCVTGPNGAYVEGPSESVRTKGHADHKAAKANETESGKSLLGTSGSRAEMANTSSVTRKADASADGPSQPPQTQQHKAVQTGSPPQQLPGKETSDYNPLQMRGPNAKIFKGNCKWYNCQRGFGFIIPSNTALMFGDVFVHHTVIHAEGFRSLNTGETVEFTVIQKEGKWHATSVTGPNGEYVEGLNSGTRKNTHFAHTESTSETATQTTQTGGKNDAEAHHANSSKSMSKLKSSPAHTSSGSSRRGLENPQSGGEPAPAAAASPTLHRHGRALVNPQSPDNNVGFNPSLSLKRDSDAKIHNGSCKWYNLQRGFGFIIPDDLNPDLGDVFVHHTVILSKGFRSLNAGERLEFTVIQKDGKWHATSVTGPDGQMVQGYPQNRGQHPVH